MQTAEEIYKKLRDCYVSSQSNNTDKAKRFRSIYEEYANRIGAPEASNITFGPRLALLFQDKQVTESVIECSKCLLQELNTVVHNDRTVTDDQLQGYYKDLVCIIKETSGIEPDEKTKILCGLEQAWYADGLNPEQKVAVIDDAQVINVNAGPGTGKTHLLVHKMLYYLQANPGLAVHAISFTNAAATQLSEKFNKVRSEKDPSKNRYPNCATSTIHSFCFILLSKYYEKIGKPFDFEILDESDNSAIAEEIALQCGQPSAKDRIINILENGGDGQLVDIVEKYKKEHNFIRVDEILDMFIKEFKNSPEFGQWLSDKVDCLLVDESQDLTEKIYQIISLLADNNPNLKLFFVGDPRQNIFGFNGGSYENFRSFIETRNVSEHALRITYRCPQAVIDKVNPLQFDDCPNPELKLNNEELRGSCKVIPSHDRSGEAAIIVELIKRLKDHSKTCVICTGLWYLNDTATLLNQNHIPFIVKGGKRFLIKAIKILNYCLRMVSIPESKSMERLRHFIRDFSKSPLYVFLKQKEADLKNVDEIFVPDLVREISEFLVKNEYVGADKKDIFEKYAEKSGKCKDVAELLFACSTRKNDEYSEFYERDFNVECLTEVTEQNQPITLTTIHSAKGLEWDNVIFAGVSENILPSYRCYGQWIKTEETRQRINDERKKYYVAVTRCKKNLFITYALTSTNKYGRTFHNGISKFVIDTNK